MTKIQQTNLALAQLKAKPSFRKSQIVEKFLQLQEDVLENAQAIQNRQLVEISNFDKVKLGFVRETKNRQYLIKKISNGNFQIYDNLFRQVTVATLTLGQATKTIRELIN